MEIQTLERSRLTLNIEKKNERLDGDIGTEVARGSDNSSLGTKCDSVVFGGQEYWASCHNNVDGNYLFN